MDRETRASMNLVPKPFLDELQENAEDKALRSKSRDAARS